jgi:fatty-acyl-CoA synthase
VNVNPAFQQSELRYCLQKVGIKTLVMAEKFKSSDYIKIFREIVPQVTQATNPLDLGHIPDFPDLKNVVLIGDTDVRGMLNFKDLDKIHTERDAVELIEREKNINFEDATNI